LQKDAQAVVMAYDGKQQTRKFTQRVQMAVGVELTVVSFGGKNHVHGGRNACDIVVSLI
jgi:hypothetical protein